MLEDTLIMIYHVHSIQIYGLILGEISAHNSDIIKIRKWIFLIMTNLMRLHLQTAEQVTCMGRMTKPFSFSLKKEN